MTWIAGLPLPRTGTEGGFSIELAAGSDPIQPFVSLGDGGRFSRVLLARLTGPGGATVQLLALKLQREAYRALGSAAQNLVDNREVEAMWQRERDHLQRLDGRGAPRLLASGPDDGRLPAMAFDRRTGRLFPVVSPLSWAPLQTCRDDALLRDSGLEPWTGTTARYLYCPKDQGHGAFYTWSSQDGQQHKSGVRVRRRHDLYRDLVAAHAQLTAEQRQLLQPQLPDLCAVLADLTVDGVEQRIVPLGYYETWALVTELQDLHFDEFCDLAGGASLEQACAAAMSPGRLASQLPLAQRLAGEQQWLSAPWTTADRVATLAGDPTRVDRLGLEAAWLKLHAFAQVCRATLAYHRELGVPHLGLSSDNIMLRLAGSGGAPWPVRWGFEPVLIDVGASHRRALSGLGLPPGMGPLCLPATDAVRTFVSPLLDPTTMQRELTVQVQAAPRLDGETAIGLTLELRSGRERFDSVRQGDLVRVLPDSSLPATGEQALLARITAVDRDSATAEVHLDPGRAGALPAQPFAFPATATFHRRLQTPCDLFALGMLLARALLVHDERDVFAVREVWDRILDKLDMMLSASKTADGERTSAAMRNLIDAERVHLGSASLLWPKALRQAAREPVPATLWRELLLSIGRLLTTRPGFSFASHHGDVPDDEPDLPLQRLLQQTDELLAALQFELTEAAPRADELAAIASDLSREVTAAMASKAGGGA